MLKMYGIKNCDSVKKAQKFLTAHHLDFEFIDFRENPISKEVLQGFVDAVGWNQLINKRSTTYRQLTDDEKLNITLELTLKNPTLIKRPVLQNNSEIRVGFSEKTYSDLI